MRKIAITGGTGFLGGFVIERLKNEGTKFVILTRSEAQNENYVQTDYSFESLSNVLANVDTVIHLAFSRKPSSLLTSYFEDINNTENLYRACVANSINNIIFASSISVYSDVSKIPWNESEKNSPSSMYGLAKIVCEELGNKYNLDFNLKVKNLRLAHLFGPSENNKYMINVFMDKAYKGEEITVNPCETVYREFLYVKDAANAIVESSKHPDLIGTFNIGNQEVLNNIEVAQKINNIFGNKSKIIINRSLPKITKSSRMNSEKAMNTFFIPQYNFSTALEDISIIKKGETYV